MWRKAPEGRPKTSTHDSGSSFFRSRWVFGLSGLLLLILSTLAVVPIAKGWTDPPVPARVAAQAALDAARLARADRYAPAVLAAADSTMLAALKGQRRMEDRLIVFRDFRPSVLSFMGVQALADSARQVSLNFEADLAMQAADALEQARTAVREAEACRVSAAKSIHRRVTQARTLLLEAEAYASKGSHAEVLDRAMRAETEAASVCGAAADLTYRFVEPELVARWREWMEQTIAESKRTGKLAVIVIKERNEVRVYRAGSRIRTYAADLGSNQLHRKLQAGDKATPEGRYRVTKKNPASKYYLALLLDYPNDQDRARLKQAIKEGRAPKNAQLGGLIELHGDGGRGSDWTLGCVALSNPEMKELYDMAAIGTPVTIVGGTGEQGRFSRIADKAGRR